MKVIALFLTIFLAQNCNRISISENSPFAIESVATQKWIGGREYSRSETNFEIKLKDKLPEKCKLQKVYFQTQEANFEEQNPTTFVAHFYQKQKGDLVFDADPKKEYGNSAPEIRKSKFSLQANEAVLEYTKDSKTYFFKIKNILEKEAIAYPVQNPRN
jgi:hypothetical protein